MEWFSQNWVWVLFFAGFIGMHMFGHGGHGGGHTESTPASKDSVQRTTEQRPGHHH